MFTFIKKNRLRSLEIYLEKTKFETIFFYIITEYVCIKCASNCWLIFITSL